MFKYGILTILCMLLSTLHDQAYATGNYVILAPQYLRAKHPYQVSISTFDFNGFSKLHMTIEGNSENDEPININENAYLKSSQTQIFEFDTTILPQGSYSLSLLSGSGAEVNRTIFLTNLDKSYSVLIQTDKPIYKPGNTVKFRVLVLDQATKPIEKPKAIRVTLSDPDGNEIKEWPYAMLRNGIFQSQLEISNEPNLGNWSITANIYGKDHSIPFQVNEYKVPKYEIRISTPKTATIDDKELIVDVEAWYTFGRTVKGNLTVTVNGLIKTAKINGYVRLSFSMADLVKQRSDESGNIPVEVNAVIRDQYTRENIKATSLFHIFDKPYKFLLKKSSKYFIAGHPYRCAVQIKDPNGNNLHTVHQAIINVVFTGENSYQKSFEMRITPESDGTMPLTLSVPEQAVSIELDVTYGNADDQFTLHSKKLSNLAQIQASIVTEHVTPNQPIVVQVQSSVPLSHLTYHVIAKGKILAINQLRFDESDTIQFEISATPEMVPNAKIFVFSFHNGQLLKDTVPVQMNSLNNWVKVTLSKDRVKPGERVQVTVESIPNSTVGLLAVDRGTWLMSDDNQLTKQKVLNEIKGFSEEIEAADDDIMDMELITNAINPTAISARFGNYMPDEEDAYIPPRKEFPESWLWLDQQEVGSNGKLHLTDTVPDSITSWEITAFSLNPQHGLGVLDEPVSLTVSKPFFIMLNVPNSIKKSETAIVKVTVFNELDETSYVGVTLKNSRQEFEFVDNRGRKDVSYQIQNVVLSPNSASTVLFKIKSKKMGNIVLKVIAESTEASDSLEQLLRVTPESFLYTKTQSRYIQLDERRQTYNIDLAIPKHFDENTVEVHFSIQGNLLGDAADGLEEMIRLPSGSGELNILKMVPNVLVLDYMFGVGKINVFLKNQATRFLNMGYQNQLKFRHEDGSFSTFGKEDNIGSVFSTALVAKTFQQASQFITVDKRVIEKAYDWLQQQQSFDGSFSERGEVPEFGLQRKYKEKVILTAYILIAFLENDHIAKKYKSVIDKGTKYLASKIQDMNSKHALSLTTYALQLAQYEQGRAFTKLIEVSNSNNEFRWWDDDAAATEATAYGLLCYIKSGIYVDSLPILKWLISKRHLFGPDNIETTFVELQAIAEHSKKVSPNRNNYNVSVLMGSKKLATLTIDPASSLSVQNISLPSDVKKVDVMVEGTGIGIFSFHYHYKTNILNLRPRFDVEVQTLSTSTSHYLDLKICAKFKPSEAYEKSKLALMEITFPSGYIALDESVEDLEKMRIIKKVTTKYDDASLWLYFESLPEEFLCLPVTGFRESEVLQQIPGSVRVYDFFDNSRVAIKHFDGKQLDVCDICDNGCPPECGK
ncbi:thioester-containing protein 1 allele R1-like [Armigeres subalbatus]|uniref:thioester-containing protein 1 allele R1-like n=1 Tax=Armigeres subalbatus TaxID=124917 RepID=UPI002ED32802